MSINTIRTAIDQRLMAKSGLDEVTLARLRRELQRRYRRLRGGERRQLAEGGIASRFAFLNGLCKGVFLDSTWHLWLRYLEHTDDELAEMGAGKYPVSPYLVRVYSTLFGISVDYLCSGAWPVPDRAGSSIDVV